LELNPDLPEGLTVMAWNRLIHHYDWVAAEKLLRKALKVQANNSDALHWLSHVLSWQGYHDEAIKMAERAVESDPLSPLMRMNLSYILMDARHYERSVKVRNETLELRPDYAELWRNMWLTFLRARRYDDATNALAIWASGTGRNPQAATRLGRQLQNYAETGTPVELPHELLDELEIGSENLGQIYAAAGDGEAALRALRTALDEHAGSRSVLSMKINPLYDFIRDDPRFVEMQEEAGLSP
jgi:tetratricopeptide (TPR) repeat protein